TLTRSSRFAEFLGPISSPALTALKHRFRLLCSTLTTLQTPSLLRGLFTLLHGRLLAAQGLRTGTISAMRVAGSWQSSWLPAVGFAEHLGFARTRGQCVRVALCVRCWQ